jgi:opacity protein-like surface antigen
MMMKLFGRVFIMTLALAAGWQSGTGLARAEGIFYVAPKVIFGQQKADFDQPSIKINEAVNTGQFKPIYTNEYKGEALAGRESMTYGALAFGLDFYDRFDVPLRLELEISTHQDGRTRGSGARYIPESNPNVAFSTMGEAFNYGPAHGATPGYVSFDSQSLSYTMHTAFANIYADWHNETPFTPYAGGGLGLAFIDAKATIVARSQTYMLEPPNLYRLWQISRNRVLSKRVRQMAWHLDAGLAYDITDHFIVELGYRYLDLGKDVKLDEGGAATIHSSQFDAEAVITLPEKIRLEPTHQVVLGFRYMF